MTNHPGRRWAASVAAVVVVAGVAAALGSTQAGAVTVSGVRAPAPLGQSWYVYQGYNSGTHTGDSRYGLDLTTNSSTTSTAGRAVTAPVGGTISYWQTGFGNLCVNTAEGRSYTLTHIIAAKTSGTVVTGQKLGTVAAAGQKNNNGVAHLHFEMWSGRNCYKQSAPIPFDDAHHARICGAPNFTASGPNGGNGTWSRKTFKSVPCGAPAGPQSLMGRLKYVAKVDFNGDKKSDIFYQPAASGGNPWKVSRSGTSRWSTINTGDFDPSRALIGDFNGDGKSDVFYEATSSGSNPWKVSWSGTSKWATINSGDFDPSRALVGDFNGDGKSDIFYQASASGSNPWKVSWSGRSKWATINVADFDPTRAW